MTAHAPCPQRIAAYEAAMRAGAITFDEHGQGTVIVDVASPLVKAMEWDWPTADERCAALHRIASDHLQAVERVRCGI